MKEHLHLFTDVNKMKLEKYGKWLVVIKNKHTGAKGFAYIAYSPKVGWDLNHLWQVTHVLDLSALTTKKNAFAAIINAVANGNAQRPKSQLEFDELVEKVKQFHKI